MSAPYNPQSRDDRRALGTILLAAFYAKGFTALPGNPGAETVMAFPVAGMDRVEIRVYTTVVPVAGIDRVEARSLGADAIRAVALYTTVDGQTRGLAREARVFRVGTIDAIVDRAVQRARDVYGAVLAAERCARCGAPKFTAKSGNVVCADACWTRTPVTVVPVPVPAPAPPPPPPPAPPAAVVPAPCIDGWEHYGAKVTSDEPGGMW